MDKTEEFELSRLKVRFEFTSFEAAEFWRSKHSGRTVCNKKTGRIFWYSDNYTVSEIMADLPSHEAQSGWKGFVIIP